jgi:hypothetical protein
MMIADRQELSSQSGVSVLRVRDFAVHRSERFGINHRNEFAFAEFAVRYESWTIPKPLDG